MINDKVFFLCTLTILLFSLLLLVLSVFVKHSLKPVEMRRLKVGKWILIVVIWLK